VINIVDSCTLSMSSLMIMNQWTVLMFCN
jgi:hypothetical protein